MHAPAPTPNSPERHGQYFSRTPQSREHNNSVTSRYIRRRETLTSVYDEDETMISREALGSPEGERVGEEFAVEPVFLTEGALSRDPSLVLNKNDAQEWPQDKMIINVIENSDDMPRMVRSPSPGSKTYIPQDILAEFHGDPYGRKGMHVAGQKIIGKPNIVKEPEKTDSRGYMAPAWRPPRSRTPIQFVDTPSRRAPRPLKQPPKESVPKSLTVKPLAQRTPRRPKSTPPRMSSSKDSGDLSVHQILSDSTLGSFILDDPGKYSMDAQATLPSVDTSGSIPPPPSPEAILVTSVVPGTPRLDPVSEVEEKSSITSAGLADGVSQVEGRNVVANLSEVEEGDEVDESNEEVDLGQNSKDIKSESNNEKETDLAITEDTETIERRQNDDSQDTPDVNLEGKTVSSFFAGDEATDKTNLPVTDTNKEMHNKAGRDENESEKQKDDKSTYEDTCTTTEESDEREKEKDNTDPPQPPESGEREQEKDNTDPPQPPASPDIVSTPDFTEGLDMNLDLEAELRAAMEGLDDLGDGKENGEKRTSPELEPW